MIKLDIHKTLQAAEGDMNLHLKLAIQQGEFVALFGESGAGKTSTFRLLSGLMNPDEGKIIVNEKVWFDAQQKINRRPQERKIGYVFQDYALFPNMTIRQNLAFALSEKQDSKIVDDLIEFMELGALQNRKPQTLSGGQQQRVALARALVQQPEILLLDEPLSALDVKIRSKLQDYLLKIHKEFNLTTILITHDLGEIIKLTDRVVVLEKGKVTRQGNPAEIFINQQVEDQFKLTGEVLKIDQKDSQSKITVLVQGNIKEILVEKAIVEKLSVGDRVLLVFDHFNPVLYKM